MRKIYAKKVIYIVCSIILIMAMSFLPNTFLELGKCSEIIFSRETGFYEEPFYLELGSKAGTIYYTLDSSEPDENSSQYSEPLLISDASRCENVYSVKTDVSLDFNKELLEQAGTVLNYGYEVPSENIDKAVVVRAVSINEQGIKGDIFTKVYWIGFDKKKAYDQVNIISVTTAPENLFDYNTGIYVTGATFDNSLINGKVDTTMTPNFGWWSANYTQRGTDWEVPAEISLINSNRDLILHEKYAMRIQGGSSRGLANKSLNFFAREEFGATTIPGELIFDNGFNMGSMNLYSGAHDTDTKLRDHLVNELCSDLNISTREQELYALFLDGEFWGVYFLEPRFEEEYFVSNFGVNGDNIVDIKLGYVEIGNKEDIDLYNSMIEYISKKDMSIDRNYDKACELIDMGSYIDYCATEIYIANADWPNNNFAMWRTRYIDRNEFSDCKWRWLIFDVNLSMESQNAESDWIEYAAVANPMFASLMYNDSFRTQLENRLVYLAENNFNPEKINTYIYSYEELMTAAMDNEYQRFYGDGKTADDFISQCEDIRLFFDARYKYIIKEYGDKND